MEANYQLKRPASFKKRKRVGTGPSAGQGKTCGRGMNGQMSRSGAKRRAWFEGGQMPLQRRVPKRGFNNHFRKQYQVINISSINKITESEITPEVLFKYKLIDSEKKLVKILSPGELETAKKVTVDACSKVAMDKIKKAGGDIIIRNYPTKIQDKEQGK